MKQKLLSAVLKYVKTFDTMYHTGEYIHMHFFV